MKEMYENYKTTVLQQVAYLLKNDPSNSFAEALAKEALTELSTEGMLTVMFDNGNSEELEEEIIKYLDEEVEYQCPFCLEVSRAIEWDKATMDLYKESSSIRMGEGYNSVCPKCEGVIETGIIKRV